MDTLLFALFAGIAILSAVVMIMQRHPVSSALALVGVMGSLAILYLLLGATFIAAAQLIVYAGAIMVLFLFVIMLLNAGAEPKPLRQSFLARALGFPLGIALIAILGFLIQRTVPPDSVVVRFADAKAGSPQDIGRALFTQYLLPFEVTSVLVLIAILGAVVLARKET
ncbi:MAG: NADH-quinone oxidoreductase subunit J [Acidobacteria bacterium]|nr:NADH-quinone oxidoreductase subunit J [Acidobacteriota bacterium]